MPETRIMRYAIYEITNPQSYCGDGTLVKGFGLVELIPVPDGRWEEVC